MLLIVWFDYQFFAITGWEVYGIGIALVTLLAMQVAAGELVEMWKRDGREVSYRVSLLGVTAMMVGASLPIWYPRPAGSCPLGFFGGTFVGLYAAIVIAVIYEVIWFRAGTQAFGRLLYHVFIFVYFSMLAGGIPYHRGLFGDNGFGLCAVIAVIATVKFGDASAYFVGKMCGRRRLAPQISAGKTIEGAIGGIVGGTVGAGIVFKIVAPLVAGDHHIPTTIWVIGYGVFIGIAALLGDLAESIIKRDANCKDSSVWLPGLGGMLDILDSLIFAVPASCIYWIVTN